MWRVNVKNAIATEKPRQKQLAVEKQRRIPYGKFDKERLQAHLLNSRELIEEPELEGLYFDFNLMYTHVLESVHGL